MEPVGSILLLLRPRMGYDYIVIQVIYGVELLEQRRFYPIFVKIWIPIYGCENMDLDKWSTTVWYRVTRNPQEFLGLTGCQQDPRI